MRSSIPVRALTFCVVLAFTAASSWAGYGGYGGGGIRRSSGGGGSPAPPPPPPPPPIDHSASTKARQDVQTATAEVTRATAALEEVTRQLRKARLEPTEPWKNAAAALAAAKEQYDAARDAVLKKLKADPGYQGAVAERAKALADHEAMTAATSIDERYRIANAMVSTAQQLTTLEAAALSADVTASKAKAALDAASATARALQDAFDATLANDAAWSAAAKALEDRKQKLADAKKALADAQANEAQQARQRVSSSR